MGEAWGGGLTWTIAEEAGGVGGNLLTQGQEKAGLAAGRQHEAGAGQRRLSLQGEQAGSNVRIQVSVKRTCQDAKAASVHTGKRRLRRRRIDASTAQHRASTGPAWFQNLIRLRRLISRLRAVDASTGGRRRRADALHARLLGAGPMPPSTLSCIS